MAYSARYLLDLDPVYHTDQRGARRSAATAVCGQAASLCPGPSITRILDAAKLLQKQFSKAAQLPLWEQHTVFLCFYWVEDKPVQCQLTRLAKLGRQGLA
ncbi:hypothetical protein HRR83_007938 [Exophiala dermatitidis]|uniref:Uncharacterized protein n=1 Tax=Exophiala dermatitidis TaxID=5970 RepID=A0AAN6ET33_EXODE|nr:hypothetical protein HRR74_007408 [Exophiala dermatitidis]KAJ4510069.1 hypothetical protein HRR73_006866 [Exophiala dermatitidis]KAJ4539072.1 hypothetical protein HRR77_006487 [Exophiala dermatitidis]KAJ4540648.1 hypothetical protein HRR76_004036 [Exophiala dermatitidis]KAJ4564518.1 hypothetical protein HRR79_005779 [Exophiala dermatitidis]